MEYQYENARPLNLQQWSERPEVEAVVDHIFDECRVLGGILRERNQRTCLKVVLLNLYLCYSSDPTRYVRYSRSNRTWIRRYNQFGLSAEQVRRTVDHLKELGYVTDTLGEWSYYEEDRRQSRMKATEKLINCFTLAEVCPLMVSQSQQAETILLKDEKKKLMDYEETKETRTMREQMQVINGILSKTLINMYLPDEALRDLNRRMITGKLPERAGFQPDPEDDQDEKPRGAIDFTAKSLSRIFNNRSFHNGGRLYCGWWQGVPRDFRKYIRINWMNTVEVDFSAMHINLIYWLQGVPVPDGDLYTLAGFPDGTRKVVKQSLLTLINAKTRTKGMNSIREHIAGTKVRKQVVNGKHETVRKKIPEDDRIVLPPGVKIEEVIEAFEEKHTAIKNWFFSGKGVELQYWDSEIAIEILLRLAEAGVPCLPLHDSFIVSHPQERGLRLLMSDAFYKVTGRYPKMDAKDSLLDENKERGEEAMKAEYQMKMADDGRTFSQEFTERYHTYVNSTKEWKRGTGRNNQFLYSKSKKLNRETYD